MNSVRRGSDRRSDIEWITPLNNICKALAILPPINLNLNTSLNSPRFSHRLYTICVILVFISVFTFDTYGKMVFIKQLLVPIISIIDLATDVSLLVVNLSSIILINIRNRDRFIKFIHSLGRIDEQLIEARSSYKMRFYLELSVAHIFIIVYTIYNMNNWFQTLGVTIFKFYIFRDIQNYHVLMLAMLLRNYAIVIKRKYVAINDLLLSHAWRPKAVMLISDFGSVLKQQKMQIDEWNLKKLIKIFTELSSCVDEYNELFGWQFVALYINIIIYLLLTICLALFYSDGSNEIDGTSFGLNVLILSMLWLLLPIMMSIFIYSGCESAAREGNRTSTICYCLMQNLSESSIDAEYKKDLLLLAQQACDRHPRFTAAGFFDISYKVFFTMFGSIMTYLLVIIQFNE